MAHRKYILRPEEILTLVQAKDERAFNFLYHNFSPALYGITRKILRDEVLAQDVLQEAFIKIWNQLHTYHPEKGTLFTWMLNVTRNLAIDKLRSKDFKTTTQSESLSDFVGMEKASPKNEEDLAGWEVDQWLEKLKPEHKEVIELVYLKGYSQTEATQLLQIPLGTLKSRAKSALEDLRKWLRE